MNYSFKSRPKVHSGLRSGVAGWSRWFVRKVSQNQDCKKDCHTGVDGEQNCHGVTSSFTVVLADDEVTQEEGDSDTDSVEHLTDAGGSGSLVWRKHKIINIKKTFNIFILYQVAEICMGADMRMGPPIPLMKAPR